MPTHVRELHRQSCTLGKTERGFETAWKVWREEGGMPLALAANEAVDAVHALYPLDSALAGFPGVFLTKLRPQEIGRYVYEVTGEYTVPDTPPVPDDFDNYLGQSQSQRSPTNPHGAKFSLSVMIVEEYDFRDLKGRWFVNSAGDPLAQLIPIPVTIEVRRVTLNRRELPDTGQVGMASGHNLFADVQAEADLHVNKTTGVYTPYYVVSYEMWTHTRRPWVPTIVWDAGYNEIKNGELVPIVNPKTKQPYNSIRLLNGSGQKLPDGVQNAYPLEFYVREEGEFSIPFLT